MVFSKEAKIWIVQIYTSDLRINSAGITLVNFTITNKKTVPGVKGFKRVIVENFAKGISQDTLLRVSNEPIDITKRSYL